MKKANDKRIIIKALLNGIVTWLVVALVRGLIKDMGFVQTFTAPYTITAAITACLGSYIGFMGKANAVTIKPLPLICKNHVYAENRAFFGRLCFSSTFSWENDLPSLQTPER